MSWTVNVSQAQQSAYFILGEDQFNGLEVYDVIQDEKDNYLFSTNEGLFYYDFLNFEPIGCALAKSASMFNFVADPSGNIYCSNINHQIFRIHGGDCQLLYELLPDEDSPDMSLVWTQDNALLVCAKKIIRLGPDGALLGRFANLPGHDTWGRAFQTPDGKVLLHCPETDSLLIYQESHFSYQKMGKGFPTNEPNLVLNFFAVKKRLYAVTDNSKTIFEMDPRSYQLKALPFKYNADRSQSLRIYQTAQTAWFAGTLPGTIHLEGSLGDRIPQVQYSKYFISDVFQDREGNILLSTFDHGILVIPDLQIPDVIQAAGDDPVTALYVDPSQKTLYLGSSKGKLSRYANGEFEALHEKGMRPIKGIYGTGNTSKIIFDIEHVGVWLVNGSFQSLEVAAALKAAVFLHDQLAYLGTSQGIFRCEWLDNGKTQIQLLPDFSFRTHQLVYDQASNALLASTARGLYYIPMTGGFQRLSLAGQDIYPTALYADSSAVYAATKSDGILVVKAGKISAQIQPEMGKMEAINKLVVDEGRIFAKSSHGIYQFGPQGELQRNIGKTFGFLKARVFDFALAGNVLWVSHTGGVQAIDLTFSKGTQVPACLRIARVTVNDQAVPSDQAHSFSAAERKIKFELASPTLRNRESLRIHYQLEGFDKDWIVKPSGESAIVYNALAPGKYRFLAKAENQGQFSAAVAYSFAIPAPIYTQWWFSAACILFIASIVVAIYRRQSTIQHRKAQQINELNASKLAAIQSQMNPHFIFNAMNSIQDLILKGDIENSYSYVTTFSNLVRSTLKYSEKDFIDFEQELELLRLYLSLEKLRFEDELEYSIINLVDEDIQLPPLLIQPFVENALLHGLLHKEGIKKLVIRFELREALICTIEDNGIGRQRAMEIRERQRGEHESFSGKAIRKRFDILSDVHKGEFGYVHEDLMADGQAVGTRIILQIPVRRRF